MGSRLRPFLDLAATAVALAFASTASAQERLEVFTEVNREVHLVELDASAAGFGQLLRVQPLPAGTFPRAITFLPELELPVALAGGRFLVWSVAHPVASFGGNLLGFDRRTRRLLDVSTVLPRDWDGYPVADARVVAVDPRRARLFIASRFGQANPQRYALWMLDLETPSTVLLGTQDFLVLRAVYAAATDALFYWDPTPGAPPNFTRSIVTVDATTGQERRRWTTAGFPERMFADAEGRHLWLNRNGAIERVDAATGATLARNAKFGAANALLDLRRGWLLVRHDDFVVALDALALTELGRARIAYTPDVPERSYTVQSILGRDQTAVYTARSDSITTVLRPGRTGREDFVEVQCGALDVDQLRTNGVRRASVSLLDAVGAALAIGFRDQAQLCDAVAVPVMSPFTPDGLAATVSGQTVTLAWADPGDTTSFELEFGFAPGQRAGAAALGRTASITLSGVPPGTYFVRVRALNEVGRSAASNDIQVVVH